MILIGLCLLVYYTQRQSISFFEYPRSYTIRHFICSHTSLYQTSTGLWGRELIQSRTRIEESRKFYILEKNWDKKEYKESTIYLKQERCWGYRDILIDIVLCWILMQSCDKTEHCYCQQYGINPGNSIP